MTDRAPRPEGMSDLADLLESRATAIHEWLTNDESSGIIEILHDDDHDPPAIAYALMREAAETIRRLRADGATLRERVLTRDQVRVLGEKYLTDKVIIKAFNRYQDAFHDRDQFDGPSKRMQTVAAAQARRIILDELFGPLHASAPKEPTPHDRG